MLTSLFFSGSKNTLPQTSNQADTSNLVSVITNGKGLRLRQMDQSQLQRPLGPGPTMQQIQQQQQKQGML